MSIKVTSWVWENAPQDLEPAQLLILLAIADAADDEGETAKGLRKAVLSRKARVHEATVDRQTTKLVARGLLAREERAGRSNVWRIPVPWAVPHIVTHPQEAGGSTPPQDDPPAGSTPQQQVPPTPPHPVPPVGSSVRGGPPRSKYPQFRSSSVLVPSVVPSRAETRANDDTDADVLPLPGMTHSAPTAVDAKPSTRGTFLSPDWQPTREQIAWARAEAPGLDPAVEAEKFRDYWLAASGQNARKRDWNATWRTWIRNARKYAQTSRPGVAFRDEPAQPSKWDRLRAEATNHTNAPRESA